MRIGGRDLAFFELGMAAMAYQLQAVEEGLYVHPIVGFNADKAKEVLGIDAEYVLEIMMVVGHPGDIGSLNDKHRESELSSRIRKPIDKIAEYDQWSGNLVP
jgi:nitroreductase